jgi:hypothetical protein
MSDSPQHEHTWAFGGLRYEIDESPLAGTSARRVIYHDWFYCSGCLAQHLLNARSIGTSYDKRIEGATPR